ncbi:MAG: polymer-forming cytoskeletal protein, partial [Steroidobacteraceae bacterium]|nr:polymer-forming cytoskeletal protein [Steroidobacteraceae bacterium]
MKTSFPKSLLLVAATAALSVCAIQLHAQQTEPPAPPAAEAPPPPAPPAPPAAPQAPAAEAPDAPAPDSPNAESPDDRPWVERADERQRRWGPRHHGDDLVTVGGNSHLPRGQRANTVVSILGSSTSEGDVSDAVVSILGDTRVTGTTHDAIAVLGSTYLNGRAHGDVVAVLGSVELGPQAEVHGDVVVIGGKLTRQPGAVVHGSTQNVLSFPLHAFDGLRPWARHAALYLRPLAFAPGLGWAWGLTFAFLALYVLIAALF